MNDTIMASVAALKSRTQETTYSLYTGFRSVRSPDLLGKRPTPAQTDETVTLHLDPDVMRFFRAHSDDHTRHIRAVLENYVRENS